MPKIDEETRALRMAKVVHAALELFKKQGFHGVGLRQIAHRAGVSLGNIYNHFESKEAVFESILGRLHAEFTSQNEPLAAFLQDSRFPDDLEDFGRAIGAMVDAHADYLTLIYVDIAEFQGRHVRTYYANLTQRFEAVLGDRFRALRKRGTVPGVDPAVAFTVIYMQFFNYFIVERLIGARAHLGLTEPDAIKAIASLFRRGVGGWCEDPAD